MKARATCPLDCPDACSLLLTLEEGRLSRVEGDPRHPVTRGFACGKTYRYPERVRERLLYPMRRVGNKGEGRFERISWEEALEEIAERLRAILDTHGGEAILPYHYAGTMGLVENQHPLAFFRAIGASELEETICSTAGSAAWEMTYGPRLGPDPEEVPEARYILLWGINSLSTNSHLTPFLKEARRRGAKVVHIDPYENPTSRFADEHIKLRPGTDAALAYALAHLLFRENLVDWEYLKEAATGLEAFQEEARKWPPERAEALTGVPKEAIERLARELGEAKRVFLRVGYGMTRHPGGGNALRAAILLPALVGAWRYPGCGALLSTSGAFPLNKRFLGGRHLLEGSHPHEGYFRPNPRVRRINMNQLASALTRLAPPHPGPLRLQLQSPGGGPGHGKGQGRAFAGGPPHRGPGAGPDGNRPLRRLPPPRHLLLRAPRPLHQLRPLLPLLERAPNRARRGGQAQHLGLPGTGEEAWPKGTHPLLDRGGGGRKPPGCGPPLPCGHQPEEA